jgi:cytochrome c oxidase subunit 2
MAFSKTRVVIRGLALAAAAVGLGGIDGQPQEWEINLQPAATPIMDQIHEFNTLLSIIIVLISIFVLSLLAYAVWRFRERSNPIPSKTSHNTLIEVLWTVVPVLILVLIAVPSFKLLYHEDVIPQADLTIKATGHQWYWSYEYPDNGDIAFDSFIVADDDLQPGQPRLLTTDTNVVLPIDTTIRVLITADDVIHSWAVPAFGVKTDAIPGRVNETWMKIERVGMYYGQCSELCGDNHGFMPIAVKAVSKEDFKKWVGEQKAAMAAPKTATQVADASAAD